jgi:hypothetical protein
MVQSWNKDNAPFLKYHGSDMYLLAPGLLPCDPLDTPDLRYLNGSHGIVTNSLEPSLGVTLFNEQWFDGHLPVDDPSHEHVSVNMRLDGPSPNGGMKTTHRIMMCQLKWLIRTYDRFLLNLSLAIYLYFAFLQCREFA